MSNKIWVYIDQFKGEPLPASWEVIGAARTLAGGMGSGVTAMVFGQGVEGIAETAFHYGADEVVLADDPTLEDYRSDPYASLLSKLAGEGGAEVILIPTSTRGRELAAMTAVDLKTGVMADVTAMEIKDGRLSVTRPVYGGKLLSTVICKTDPQIVTLRGRAFPKPELDESLSGTLTKVDVVLAEDEISTKILEYSQTEGGVSLVDANAIVSGGRGVSNNPGLTPPDDITDEKEQEKWRAQQGFKLVGDLAEVLGAAVGASRAAVDADYIPYKNQVGQTGKVVSPDLYIAAGISGAIQHQAGIRTSKVIVAINRDPDAPIFKLARFGVVGDLFEILPPLTEAFKAKLGK